MFTVEKILCGTPKLPKFTEIPQNKVKINEIPTLKPLTGKSMIFGIWDLDMALVRIGHVEPVLGVFMGIPAIEHSNTSYTLLLERKIMIPR